MVPTELNILNLQGLNTLPGMNLNVLLKPTVLSWNLIVYYFCLPLCPNDLSMKYTIHIYTYIYIYIYYTLYINIQIIFWLVYIYVHTHIYALYIHFGWFNTLVQPHHCPRCGAWTPMAGKRQGDLSLCTRSPKASLWEQLESWKVTLW